jgi:hypothetical protein
MTRWRERLRGFFQHPPLMPESDRNPLLPARWAIFWVCVALLPPRHFYVRNSMITAVAETVVSDLSGRRILIIENDPVIALDLHEVIEENGGQTYLDTASNSALASFSFTDAALLWIRKW